MMGRISGWRKTWIIVTAIAGLVLSGAAIFFSLHKVALRSAYSVNRNAPPFKFAHRVVAPIGNPSVTGSDSGGLTDFTSNIPVIVLRSESPGSVSSSKSYSPFRMEIYVPTANEPACLTNAPLVTTRVGLRFHGMVSRVVPKL